MNGKNSRNILVHATVLLSFVLLVSSCENNSVHSNWKTINLIKNSSFEVNGQPSLEDWTADTTLAKIVQDAPVGVGSWSLELVPGQVPEEGFARTYVVGQSGKGIYKLTVWVKDLSLWKGRVVMGQWVQNRWAQSKDTSFKSTEWTTVCLIDTISLEPADTIAVHLSAGATEAVNARILFDFVTLEREN